MRYDALRDNRVALVQRWLVAWAEGERAALQYTRRAIRKGVLAPDDGADWAAHESARRTAEAIWEGRVGRVLRDPLEVWHWDATAPEGLRSTLLFGYLDDRPGEIWLATFERYRLEVIPGVRVIKFRSRGWSQRDGAIEVAIVPPTRIEGDRIIPASWTDFSESELESLSSREFLSL